MGSLLTTLRVFCRAAPGHSRDGRVGAEPSWRPAPPQLGGPARGSTPLLRIARVGFLRTRSRLSVFASPPPPSTAALGPPFAWEFCGRLGSAVTSQRAGPAAAMVAKDYPFYLTVKRANSSLEVPPASSPAKDAEVRTSTWTSSVVCLCLHRFLCRLPPSVTASLFPSLTRTVPLFLSISHPLSPASPSLSLLPPFPNLSVDQV